LQPSFITSWFAITDEAEAAAAQPAVAPGPDVVATWVEAAAAPPDAVPGAVVEDAAAGAVRKALSASKSFRRGRLTLEEGTNDFLGFRLFYSNVLYREVR
jgi:hypothetical protein